MKKLFIFFLIMITSLSLWAAKWKPQNLEKTLQKYEAFVKTLSYEEYAVLLQGRLALDRSLERINNIELYDENGLLNKASANEIEEELKNIIELYNEAEDASDHLGKAFGTSVVFKNVKTKDDPQLGRLDEVFLKFANLNIYLNEDFARILAEMANKFQSDYDFIANK